MRKIKGSGPDKARIVIVGEAPGVDPWNWAEK